MSSAIFGFARLKGVQSGDIAYNAEQLRTLTYKELTDDEEYADDGKHIKFAPFFAEDYKEGEYSNKLLGSCNEIKKTDRMYIQLSVNGGGTLKNGVITINNGNFIYSMKMLKNSFLKKDCLGSVNKIELNNIQPGNTMLLMGDIYANIRNANDYSRENEITLTGTWVPDDKSEEEVEINKTMKVMVDWYGSAKADISAPYTRINLTDFRNSGNKVVEFDFNMEETKRQLLVKQNVVDVTIPQLFETWPDEVVCVNGQGEYDENAHILHIKRQTSSNNNTYTVRLTYPQDAYDQLYNGYTLSVPIEGYFDCYNNENEEFEKGDYEQEEVDVPNEEGIFRTKKVSATKGISFYTNVGVTADYMFSADITSKSYITVPTKTYAMSKENLIDAYDGNKDVGKIDYTVGWSVTKTTKETESALGITMKEIQKEGGYGDTWDGYQVSDYVKNTKIYFKNSEFIKENGWVKVYDNDTDTLIKEFSYKDVHETYTSAESAYAFDAPITHIRIETSEVNPSANSRLVVYSVKEVNVDVLKTKLTREQLARVQTVKTNLNGILSNGASVTGSDECSLVTEKSYARIEVSKEQLSAIAEEPAEENIKITVPGKNISLADWKNGEFLVGFESSNMDESESPISYLELDSVTTNGNEIKISGYELLKKDGKYFIKIVTDNETKTSGFTIDINCKMLVNPMVSSSTIYVNLYSYNGNLNLYHYGTLDIYDVNDNENTNEIVGLSTAKMYISSLNTFLTTETLSEYNKEGEVTIAPNIAEVEKVDAKDASTKETNATARVNVSLINNYDNGEVDNVVILGKIPFKNNTYVDETTSLGSKFTTTMIEEIQLPNTMSEDLKNATKIYYSTKENPTIGNSNGKEVTSVVTEEWIKENDFKEFKDLEEGKKLSDIKSYLIVIKEKKLERSRTYTFSYKISIPDDANVNDVSYSCHKVWYDYTSNNDKLPMNSQPRKLGLRVVKYCDFEILKVKKNTSHAVKGAKFKLTEINLDNTESEDDGEQAKGVSRIGISNTEGRVLFEDLRINQPYSFQEIQAPEAYELSDKIIRFKIVEDTENPEEKVKIVYLSEDGTEKQNVDQANKFDEDAKITTDSDGKPLITTKIENTPKFALNITKTDKESEEALSGVIFEISSADEEKETVITDSEGKAVFNNLKVGKEYTLKETYAKGYYLMKDVKFTLKEEDGKYTVKCTDGQDSEECKFEKTEIQSSETSDLIEVNVNIKDEKIPTYNLKIKKVEESNKVGPEEEEKVLPGATFFLERTDLQNSEFFTTGEDGTIEIENMYAHVNGKDITGEYVLKETEQPAGYLNNREEIKFVVSKSDSEADEEEGKLDIKLYDNTSDSAEEKAEKDFQTLKNIEIEDNTIIITIQDKPLFKLTKVDQSTGEPLANVEFIIYQLSDDGSIAKDTDGNRIFAKDANGNTVGNKKEDGTYVVTTDAKGEITLPLGPGSYKAIEYGYPEGYEETPHSEVFTISGKEDDDESEIVIPDAPEEIPDMVIDIENPENREKTFEIKTIEDLVDFSYAVNSGITFSNTTVKLTKDLDFNSESSYENAKEKYKYDEEKAKEFEKYKEDGQTIENESSTEKDINGNNNAESIKDELTKTEEGAKGFPSIGTITIMDSNYTYKPFSGIFDGQGHTISNLYINDGGNGSYKGLFGYIENAVIKDLTVTGQITGKKYVGGICGAASGKVYLENITNQCEITFTDDCIGGILGSAGEAVLNAGKKSIDVLSIKSCSNSGNINKSDSASGTKSYIGGIVGEINNGRTGVATGKIVSIERCTNTGKINTEGSNNGNQIAGICGYINNVEKVKIANTENEGEIKGSDYTGGLIGRCSAGQIEVISCNNNGEVQATNYAGGLLGYYVDGSKLKVTLCHNNANISGSSYVGGLIGECYNASGTQMEITKSYNKGNITSSNSEIGGILGYVSNRRLIIYK